MKYIRKKGTTLPIYVWTGKLASRPDMEECEGPVLVKEARLAPSSPPPVITPEEAQVLPNGYPVVSRIGKIVEAIKGLSKDDFTTTGTPKPKVHALTAILGYGEGEEVTAEERNEAWEIYQKGA